MNILIIEDYQSIAQITKNILESNGFNTEIRTSKTINGARIEDNLFDLALIDINMKDGKSNMILRGVRKASEGLLIIGLASRSTWKEKVAFLNNGADDVIDYPYAIQELLARINSLLRRPKKREDRIIRHKDIVIDTDLKSATQNNQELPLRRREYTLLEYLVKNRNRMVSRGELLDKVWDYRKVTTSNTVDVHVKRLRDKLADKNLITTIHGFGYSIKAKD